MKKLLTLATVALAAIGVQAATTSWNFGLNDIYGYDDTGSGDYGPVSGMVQLIAAGNPVTSINFDANGTAADTITGETTGIFAENTAWQMVATVTFGGETYTQTYAFSIPAGLTGDSQGDAPKFADLSANIATGFMPMGVLMTSTMESEGWTKQAGPIPEPTSVALLALGLAALGLKRKVA